MGRDGTGRDGIMIVYDKNWFGLNYRIISLHEKKYEGLFLQVLKRHATVRFMFFNREDIEWFKPIELRTKMGRRGHIKVFILLNFIQYVKKKLRKCQSILNARTYETNI